MPALLQRFLQKRQIAAIDILKEQNAFDKEGKPVFDRYQYEDWQQLTGEFIKKFLGKNSKFYTDFIELKLLVVPIQNNPTKEDLAMELWNLQQANSTLQNCIIYIAKFKYLYREPSLFGLLPIPSQVAIGLAGMTLFFSIGYYTIVNKPTFVNEYKDCNRNYNVLQVRYDSLVNAVGVHPNLDTIGK